MQCRPKPDSLCVHCQTEAMSEKDNGAHCKNVNKVEAEVDPLALPHPNFAKKKRRPIRQRRQSSSDSESDHELQLNVELALELKHSRERSSGVSATSLAFGEGRSATVTDSDPWRLASGGGLADMAGVKDRNRERTEDVDVTDIGTSFSAETNKRDEDSEMQKYIEEELKKRKGTAEERDEKWRSSEDSLYELPAHLKVGSGKKSEDMLSNQMLQGIPEIELGVEAKIRNIEATEKAKLRLLQEKSAAKLKKSDSFIPVNFAVNFVQHNRYDMQQPEFIERDKPRTPAATPVPVVGGNFVVPESTDPGKRPHTISHRRPHSAKATDDYHFEKFKKHKRF